MLRPVQSSLPSLHQLHQNPVYPLLSQILATRLIYLHHRRGAAGTEALGGEQGKHRRRLLILNDRRNRRNDCPHDRRGHPPQFLGEALCIDTT